MRWHCPSVCLSVCSFVSLSPETRTTAGVKAYRVGRSGRPDFLSRQPTGYVIH